MSENLQAIHALATILHQRESAGQQRCGPGSRGCRMRHRMDATSVLSQASEQWLHLGEQYAECAADYQECRRRLSDMEDALQRLVEHANDAGWEGEDWDAARAALRKEEKI